MLRYEIGTDVETEIVGSGNWYRGTVIGYSDTHGVYMLHMCKEYPFYRYVGFTEDRIREVCTPKQNLDDAQIEAKAEELFYSFHMDDDTRSWERLVDKEGFRAIARHLATRENSKQMLRLNNWLQENIGEWGDSVTDTIIELLEKAVVPKEPTPQLINMERVMNAIHIKPELRVGMTEDRIIKNLETLHRDAAGNFTLENKVDIIKKDPVLHDLITHLGDFHNAVRVRYDIANSCGDESEVSYWRRQLDVADKLIMKTQ